MGERNEDTVTTTSDAAADNKKLIELLKQLGVDLTNELLKGEPSFEKCQDILNAIEKEELPRKKMSIHLMEQTNIGKLLSKSLRSCKRHHRTSNNKEAWQTLIHQGERLISSWKRDVEEEATKKKKKKDNQDLHSTEGSVETPGYPKSARVYHERLLKQKKDLYKDPPVMPPHYPEASLQDINKWETKLPKRKKNGDFVFDDFPEFTPNKSPEEILRAGSFGGTYFRTISSAVTGRVHDGRTELMNTVDSSWITDLNVSKQLCSSTYRQDVNKYDVKCGGSLGMWESSGWISMIDPYGWFQWYCRFFRGRRCNDTGEDERQIDRWNKCAGPKGRFRSQLCNKILRSNTQFDDVKISPVIRQNLLHWGFELTSEYLEKHEQRQSK